MANDSLVRPDTLLLACLAYTRPEIRTFGRIIDLHSTRSLELNECASASTSLLSLPAEMLLHIRAFLQVELIRQLTEETSAALADYESTLVEGLCEDCFMWNCDIYGTDVWEWVENGYKNVCDCCVKGIDHRVFSNRKVVSMQQYGQLNIKTRRQWLEAYISHSYLGGQDVWETMNESVIRYFDCNAIPQDAEVAPPACIPLQGGRYMLQKPKRGDDFGSKVLIQPFDGAPDRMASLLLRELAVDGDVEVPTSSAERSSQRFAHLLSKRTKLHASQPGISYAGNRLFRRLRAAFSITQSGRPFLAAAQAVDPRTVMLLSFITSAALVLACRLLS